MGAGSSIRALACRWSQVYVARFCAFALPLRVHFLQQRFALGEEATEEDLRDIPFCRAFAGIDPGATGTPDATTILRFRRLFERHDLATALVQEVNALLGGRGQMVRRGTPIDATPARAPSSTRNRIGMRGPEVHGTRKGNQWFFAMKAHIGVDADSGLRPHGGGDAGQRARPGGGRIPAAR